MNNKNIIRDSFIVGFALFATFFGAGNLIFPPSIGLVAGTSWIPALFGLIATGIALPILSVIAVSNGGGTFGELTKPIAKWFNTAFNLFAMICIAAAITVPRTAATTHELGVMPLAPNVPILATAVVYFALTYYFTCDKNGVIDKIGKILTPALVIILLIIVVKGFAFPLGTPVDTGLENSFSYGFLQAYQTGDLLTGLLCATVFISMIKGKGYTDEKDIKKVTFNASIIAGIGLIIVYGGLLFIGAFGNSLFPAETPRAALLTGLVDMLLGRVGVTGLSIAVMLACLTTAIGVTAAAADFISTFSKGKISYKKVVAIICVVGVFQAVKGVEKIIFLAGPFFFSCYPIAIVCTILGLGKKYFTNDIAIKGASLLVFIVSVMEALTITGLDVAPIVNFISSIPLASLGFAWIVPAIVGYIGGYIVSLVVKKPSDVK